MASEQPNIVSAARARRDEINKQKEALEAEGKELDAFLATAARIEAQLGLGLPKLVTEGPPRKATRKDIVAAAIHLIQHKNRAVSTGEIVDVLTHERWQIGTEGSSASSIVSANLSAAPEIDRNPSGPGWVVSEAGKLL